MEHLLVRPFDMCSAHPHPRVQGVREQFARAQHFVSLAARCKQEASRFRNLMAAVYPARAVVELLLEAAEQQDLPAFTDANPKESRKQFERRIQPRLPYYDLVEKIRIHDFHRFGCLPPSAAQTRVFFGGPMKLTAKKGTVAFGITKGGPEVRTTGQSSSKGQRPLCSHDGRFFDEKDKAYVGFDTILREFLRGVPEVIEDFGRLLSESS